LKGAQATKPLLPARPDTRVGKLELRVRFVNKPPRSPYAASVGDSDKFAGRCGEQIFNGDVPLDVYSCWY
jgi:hypothetical protein